MKSLQQQLNESLENNEINEGLFDGFKLRKQFTQLQGAVTDEFEKLIEENPKKYRSGEDVMRAVEHEASKLYKEYITMEGGLTFNQWWKQFSQSNVHFLNMTTFKI